METMYQTVNDSFLIDKINRAKYEVSLVAPGVSMEVAKALMAATSRLNGNVHLMVDASLRSLKRGYCDPLVIEYLQSQCCEKDIHSFRTEPDIRIGVLTVDDRTYYFTPEGQMFNKLASDSLNSARPRTASDTDWKLIGQTEINEIIIYDSDFLNAIPKSKEEQLQTEIREQQETINTLEDEVDTLKAEIETLQKEKGQLPIQRNLQYIELNFSHYRLNQLRIKIPPEILEVDKNTKNRIDFKYLVIDPEDEYFKSIRFEITFFGESMRYSIREFYEDIEKLRNKYTKQLGKPWGRVIRVEDEQSFEEERKRLEYIAHKISEKLPDVLQGKIFIRLLELFETLKPQITMSYQHYRGIKFSDDDLKCYFYDKMKEQMKSALEFFEPEIDHIYRDISREDAENDEFHECLREAFGNDYKDLLLFSNSKNK